MKKKLAVLATLAPLMMFAAGEGEKQAPRPSLVETAPVIQNSVRSLQSFIGTVTFAQSANVASQSSGAVLHVNFKEGDSIQKGTVLTKLDAQIISAQIKASRASLEETKVSLQQASKDLLRYDALRSEDAVAESVYDNSYFNVESLKRKIESLNASIKATEIERAKKETKAPFSGIIIEKKIEVGDWVQQGGTIATLINPDSAEVEVNLPQDVAMGLKLNDPMTIKINDKEYAGKVRAIIPKGDISTRTFPVKLSFDEAPKPLYDGMEASLEIQSGASINAFIVPRDAIIKRFGQQVVFANAEGKAVMLPVQVVGYDAEGIAVSAQGLQEGMKVVTKGNERIFPNSPLQDITKAK